MYYISHKDRAGDGEDKCSNNFRITVHNPDSFDYIRVYSIHRTSIDAEPSVKIVGDIDISKGTVDEGRGRTVTLTDTGTEGVQIDSQQLLYIGGRSIIARTFA